MVFISFIFMIDFTINLINGPYYECERKKYHSLYSKNT